MNESSKTILWWIAAIMIGGLCVWGIHSCNNSQKERRKIRMSEEKASLERQKMQEQSSVINDPYLYVDKNGVCHAKKDCHIVSRSIYSREDSNSPYSVSYQPKNEITDWDKFASTHQFCAKCFDSDLLKQICKKHQNKPDSVYVYDRNNEPLEKTYYEYDSFGNVVRDEKWKYKDNLWVGSIKTVFEYDSKGREIMSADYFWENGRWVGSDWIGCQRKVTYDDYGNEIRIMWYTWKDFDWELESKTEKEYDAYNNLKFEKYYTNISGVWQLKETKAYHNYYQAPTETMIEEEIAFQKELAKKAEEAKRERTRMYKYISPELEKDLADSIAKKYVKDVHLELNVDSFVQLLH